MNYFQGFDLHLWWKIFGVFLILGVKEVLGLNLDGVLLLSFKYNILKDPLGVLESWSFQNETPCSWYGVTCGFSGSDDAFRVTNLSLPNSQLLGSLPADLGLIHFLQILDLSNNSINGSLPVYLFRASRLRILDFSNNLISGDFPEIVGSLTSLQLLNLSDNALAGKLPGNLTLLRNLTVVSLRNNYFQGGLPGGFDSVQYLDLSSNLVNGSLPPNFGGDSLRYLNLSFNRFSGKIPQEFASNIPPNATIDLSFNNLTGGIPESDIFLNQDANSYSGNSELCGLPLKTLCPIPSSMATPPPNASAPATSPPAIAAIPKTIDSTSSPRTHQGGNGLKLTTILGIVIGDIAGIGILALVFIYVYHLKKKKKKKEKEKEKTISIQQETESAKDFDWASSQSSSEEYNWLRSWTCLRKQRHQDGEQPSSEATTMSDTEYGDEELEKGYEENNQNPPPPPRRMQQQEQKEGSLVTVDGGEKELELETLLKASAYILGATGSSIMYKAVLEDGTTLAVRRIGESSVERYRDFENQIRVISKLIHPNLVKIRGFYWGTDEKLVIYDFVPNGSLSNFRFRKVGSSPCHLPWEMRLKIAKGLARGLNYIHDRKHVHGNLKPSNILLDSDMEPKIGDFGLERLVTGDNSSKAGGSSSRIFGSKRSTASRDSFQDFTFGPTPSPSPSALGISPYHAPESLRSLKPNPKWDVFSFGVVLLELLTGKVIVTDETCPVAAGAAAPKLDAEERNKVLRMADVMIRADLEGNEEELLGLVRLGYSCISPVPQKRPSMKEVLQGLDKFPSSSPSPYYYGGH